MVTAVLLLGGYEPYVTRAHAAARSILDLADVQRHGRHDLLRAVPDADWLLNFLSAPKIPNSVLARFGDHALNFHPAPPEYPGVGSASLALHDERTWHGVTCHVMDERFDHGPIVRVAHFRIDPRWGYGDLWDRSLEECLELFCDQVTLIADGASMPYSGDVWARPSVTRSEFEQHPSFTAVPMRRTP